jgi:glucose/arabinose dehydrogenase
MDQEGRSPGAILGRDEPLSQYYAYGIRNSYGLDFDPITNRLWDTENGPDHSDEVNLVEPGFNSGWRAIIGFPNSTGFDENKDLVPCLYCSSITGLFDRWVNENILGIIEGRYSDPEFVWKVPIGVTAIKFLDSDKLGEEYENDVFVADYILGNIHRFELNENRDGFVLEGALADKVADSWEELEPVTFAQGLRTITDLEVGPDGYLYVLVYTPNGSIYRIVPEGTPAPCT